MIRMELIGNSIKETKLHFLPEKNVSIIEDYFKLKSRKYTFLLRI